MYKQQNNYLATHRKVQQDPKNVALVEIILGYLLWES